MSQPKNPSQPRILLPKATQTHNPPTTPTEQNQHTNRNTTVPISFLINNPILPSSTRQQREQRGQQSHNTPAPPDRSEVMSMAAIVHDYTEPAPTPCVAQDQNEGGRSDEGGRVWRPRFKGDRWA
ncbi:hypothetical protein GQ44DRAFT_717035 [Phaeosphaeriaceae sp. PMI808]|nr:hypothetical protein GQ44DRAFT_717035 [Phaeosphaeriaceae sp. PMI808]